MTIEHERLNQIINANRNFGLFGDITPIGGTIGNVFFVDGFNGDNSYDGTMISSAKRTISEGLALLTANNNDVLIVLPETYSEQITCNTQGVHIFAYGLGQAGGMSFSINALYVEIAGFIINHSTKDPLVFCDENSDLLYLHHCQIRNGSGVGIVLKNSLSFIENNLICDNTSHGISILKGSNGAQINNNKIVRNGGRGISGGTLYEDHTDNLFISNNYIASNTNHGIYSPFDFDNNNLYNNIITQNNISSSSRNIMDSPSHKINRWVDNLGIVETGIHTIIANKATTETEVVDNVILGKNGPISITLDVNDLDVNGQGGMITVRLYKLINEASSNYRLVDTCLFDVDDSNYVVQPTVSGYFTNGRPTPTSGRNHYKFIVKIQCERNLDIDREVPWKLICGE